MDHFKIAFSKEQRVSREWLRTNPDAQQHLLKKYYGSHPECLCKEPASKLYIACRGNFYYLARMPGTGKCHHKQCDWYDEGENVDSGMSHVLKTIQEKNGETHVKIGVPLGIRSAVSANAGEGENKITSQKTQQRGMTLLGFLHFLWERAGFNTWHPGMKGHRRYAQIRKYVLKNNNMVKVKQKSLNDLLYMPPVFDVRKKEEHTKRCLSLDDEFRNFSSIKKTRFFALGVLKETVEGHSIGLRLKHSHKQTVFWTTPGSLEMIGKYIPNVKTGEYTSEIDLGVDIVLMAVEVTPGGHFSITACAAMRTNQYYIPIDSQYEKQIADLLIEENRFFTKPLRYDVRKEEVFPDFILLDTEPETRMEIYGMRGMDEYNKRKETKKKYYLESGLPFWEWDVMLEDTFSPFPNKQ